MKLIIYPEIWEKSDYRYALCSGIEWGESEIKETLILENILLHLVKRVSKELFNESSSLAPGLVTIPDMIWLLWWTWVQLSYFNNIASEAYTDFDRTS
jgi:hypothetical protein